VVKGERKAIVGLDQTGTRFLCRSRLTQITSSVRWKPSRDAYVGSEENGKHLFGRVFDSYIKFVTLLLRLWDSSLRHKRM